MKIFNNINLPNLEYYEINIKEKMNINEKITVNDKLDEDDYNLINRLLIKSVLCVLNTTLKINKVIYF